MSSEEAVPAVAAPAGEDDGARKPKQLVRREGTKNMHAGEEKSDLITDDDGKQQVTEISDMADDKEADSSDPLTHEHLPPVPRFTAHTIDLSHIPTNGPLIERSPYLTARDFCAPLVPLVGLFGDNTELHKVIVQNVPRKFPLAFLSSQLTHVLPPKPVIVSNTPANAADGSPAAMQPNFLSGTPKTEGFLQLDWFAQHKQRLVSVAVLIFEWHMEVTFEHIEERILRALASFRELNATRINAINPTRIMVVLVRHSDAPESKDSTLPNFWKKANLSSKKNVFILTTISLRESLNNLEQSLWTISLEYYTGLIKAIKKSKDLVDPSYTLMQIRLNFKIAFFAQICTDFDNAMM
jgi:hypothetical protein